MTIINLSIDINKIIKNAKLKTVTKKDGTEGSYTDVTIMMFDSFDANGQNAAATLTQTKEQREAGEKPVYFGNGKGYIKNKNENNV